MITEVHTVRNDKVQVCYMLQDDVVLVTTFIDSFVIEKQKYFSGVDGLKEMFETFIQSFSEEIDFETAVAFFKPNTPTIIHATNH